MVRNVDATAGGSAMMTIRPFEPFGAWRTRILELTRRSEQGREPGPLGQRSGHTPDAVRYSRSATAAPHPTPAPMPEALAPPALVPPLGRLAPAPGHNDGPSGPPSQTPATPGILLMPWPWNDGGGTVTAPPTAGPGGAGPWRPRDNFSVEPTPTPTPTPTPMPMPTPAPPGTAGGSEGLSPQPQPPGPRNDDGTTGVDGSGPKALWPPAFWQAVNRTGS